MQPVGMNIQPGLFYVLAASLRVTPRLAGAGSRVNETRWKKRMQISRKCRGLAAYVRRRPIKILKPAQIRGLETARQIRPRNSRSDPLEPARVHASPVTTTDTSRSASADQCRCVSSVTREQILESICMKSFREYMIR